MEFKKIMWGFLIFVVLLFSSKVAAMEPAGDLKPKIIRKLGGGGSPFDPPCNPRARICHKLCGRDDPRCHTEKRKVCC